MCPVNIWRLFLVTLSKTNIKIQTIEHDISSNHHQMGTLIEVYEGFRTSDKRSFLIAIKFKAMSPVIIGDGC